MIAMIATFRIVPGGEEAFEAAFSALAATVRANESATRLYQLTRSRTEVGVYKVLELYDSQAALDAHMTSEWSKAAGPSIRPHLAGAPLMEILDAIP